MASSLHVGLRFTLGRLLDEAGPARKFVRLAKTLIGAQPKFQQTSCRSACCCALCAKRRICQISLVAFWLQARGFMVVVAVEFLARSQMRLAPARSASTPVAINSRLLDLNRASKARSSTHRLRSLKPNSPIRTIHFQ